MATNFKVTNGGLSSDFNDLFIRKDLFIQGGAFLFGGNSFGQLGDNTIVDKSSPVQTVSGGNNWKELSLGYFSAGIKTDGTLWIWGDNSSGQLGDNSIVNRSSPVQTVSGGNNWFQVTAGEGFSLHTAAIKTDGTLWAWGYNPYGQLGNNASVNRSSPVQTVSGGSNWRSVAAGESWTIAIKTDGTLWTWGQNTYGQLGDNSTTNRSSPVQTIASGTNWKQAAGGRYHSAAIKTDGTLWTWGGNANDGTRGPLGDSTIIPKSSPVQTSHGGTDWKQVACGVYSTAAIKTDGTLWLWGSNSDGQLGNNSFTGFNSGVSSPIQTISAGTNWKSVSMGFGITTALKTDNSLWTWGKNDLGQLGDSTVVSKSSPIQVSSGGATWTKVAKLGWAVNGAIRE